MTTKTFDGEYCDTFDLRSQPERLYLAIMALQAAGAAESIPWSDAPALAPTELRIEIEAGAAWLMAGERVAQTFELLTSARGGDA